MPLALQPTSSSVAKMDEKEFRCVSSTCILKSNQLPLATSVIIVILFAIQISTLIAVVYFGSLWLLAVQFELAYEIVNQKMITPV